MAQTLRDKIAETLAETMNGGQFNSATFYNGSQRETWEKRADAILSVIAESVGELHEAAWQHVEEFSVIEDSGQMAARDRLTTALYETEELGLSTPEQEKGE